MTTPTDDELRALDRELAGLMGWEHHEKPDDQEAHLCEWHWRRPDGEWFDAHPIYSSTWLGFGMLVEECERRGWGYGARRWLGGASQSHIVQDDTEGRALYSEHDDDEYGRKTDIRHALALAMRDALKAAKEAQNDTA